MPMRYSSRRTTRGNHKTHLAFASSLMLNELLIRQLLPDSCAASMPDDGDHSMQLLTIVGSSLSLLTEHDVETRNFAPAVIAVLVVAVTGAVGVCVLVLVVAVALVVVLSPVAVAVAVLVTVAMTVAVVIVEKYLSICNS